jgi:hypothetical protein
MATEIKEYVTILSTVYNANQNMMTLVSSRQVIALLRATAIFQTQKKETSVRQLIVILMDAYPHKNAIVKAQAHV